MPNGDHMPEVLPWKIVSGGQTGVDRAALDAALDAGVAVGGWCPKGRRAEDGPIDDRYPLQETRSEIYEERTKWNVRDSDGTLVLVVGEPFGGTAVTVDAAREMGRPLMIVDPTEADAAEVLAWIRARNIATLNVAGPRESAGVYAAARAFMDRLLGERKATAAP